MNNYTANYLTNYRIAYGGMDAGDPLIDRVLILPDGEDFALPGGESLELPE